jgi:hypothetical protein
MVEQLAQRGKKTMTPMIAAKNMAGKERSIPASF